MKGTPNFPTPSPSEQLWLELSDLFYEHLERRGERPALQLAIRALTALEQEDPMPVSSTTKAQFEQAIKSWSLDARMELMQTLNTKGYAAALKRKQELLDASRRADRAEREYRATDLRYNLTLRQGIAAVKGMIAEGKQPGESVKEWKARKASLEAEIKNFEENMVH